MKQVILFLFSLFISSIYAQNVDEIINKSLKALENKDYDNFRNEYSKLYLQFIRENEPSYINAVQSIENIDYKQVFQSLDELVSEGYMFDEIKTDMNFQELHSIKEWTEFINKIDFAASGYNNVLRKELNEIQYKDQGIRILLLKVQRALGVNNPTTLSIRKEMNRIDTVNAVRVQYIIDEFGWLGKNKIGSEANQTLFLIIQHVDDLVVQEKYLSILEKALNEGNAEPWHFAFLTDRILMNQGKFQIYGTQIILGKNIENSYSTITKS